MSIETQSAEAIVTMQEDGTIRLPEHVRKALGLAGQIVLSLRAADGAIVLRPAPDIDPADAWAYTPAHSEAVERAMHSPGYQLSEEELEAALTAASPTEAIRRLLATKKPVDDWPPRA